MSLVSEWLLFLLAQQITWIVAAAWLMMEKKVECVCSCCQYDCDGDYDDDHCGVVPLQIIMSAAADVRLVILYV